MVPVCEFLVWESGAAGAGYLGAASAIGRQIRVRLGLGVTVIVPQAVATGRAGCWTCAGRKTLPPSPGGLGADSEVVGGGGEGHRTGIGKLAQARAARDIDGPRRHAGLRAAPGPRRVASPTGGASDADGTSSSTKRNVPMHWPPCVP